MTQHPFQFPFPCPCPATAINRTSLTASFLIGGAARTEDQGFDPTVRVVRTSLVDRIGRGEFIAVDRGRDSALPSRRRGSSPFGANPGSAAGRRHDQYHQRERSKHPLVNLDLFTELRFALSREVAA